MTIPDLNELADRVEALSEAADLSHALWLDIFRTCRPRSSFESGRASDQARNRFMTLIEHHAFLDAAMTLAPEGGRLDHLGERRITSGWMAVAGSKHDIDADGYGSTAATAALAVTAAFLRARSAVQS